VGGVIKRAADRAVELGKDIPNALALFSILSVDVKAVKLFIVQASDVTAIDEKKGEGLTSVKGTMQMHQVYTNVPKTITYRNLSCFCKLPESLCTCHSTTKFTFNNGEQANEATRLLET